MQIYFSESQKISHDFAILSRSVITFSIAPYIHRHSDIEILLTIQSHSMIADEAMSFISTEDP